MIVNPDGSKRLPTKEEVLEDVRRNRLRAASERAKAVSGHATINNVNDGRPGEGIDISSRESHNTGPATSPADSGRVGTTNGENGSNRGNIEQAGPTDRELAGSNSSVDTRSVRYPESTSGLNERYTNVYGQQPVKNKSKLKPYRDAIAQAFKKPKVDEGKKSTSGSKHKPLSEQEARGYRENLIDVLLWQSEHMDNIITATTKGHQPVVIWSDIDRDDATTIADFLLEEGKKSTRAATLVRNMVDLRRRIQVGLITIPRAYKTMQVYFNRGLGIR